MNLTNEQIAKLIYEAYRTGRNEGLEVGHRDGYENGRRDGDAEGYERGYDDGYGEGWDKGYENAKQDAEDSGEEAGFAPEEYDCKCSQCTSPQEYDMGWNDGYQEYGIDPDLKDNEAYMDGYLQGRDDRENNVEEA